jgi:type IV pilus assembly protein PilV
MTSRRSPRRQAGVSMIEVLVSILIIVLGLLGLAGLQSHATLAEAEAFQRAQAITLVQDMVDRLNGARPSGTNNKPGYDLQYITSVPLGTGNALMDCVNYTGVERDKCEWSNALLGASEKAAGNAIGAMDSARGCISLVSGNTMPRTYEIAVVWQGVAMTKAPSTQCGTSLYGDEKQRRAITAQVTFGCLQNDPASGLCITP